MFEQLQTRLGGILARLRGRGALSVEDVDATLREIRLALLEADVHVAGPIGSMGQRVFQPIVNQQVTNVLNALENQVSDAKVTA